VYEAVSVFRRGVSIYAAPVGVWVEGRSLKVKLYPGTMMTRLFTEEPTVCICLPNNPIIFYEALLEHRVTCREAACSQSPCPLCCSVAMECSIEGRSNTLPASPITLTLTPLCCTLNYTPTPYTRLMGCSVELLIAATRIKYFASVRRCAETWDWCRRGAYALECIRHASRGVNTVRRLAERVFAEAASLAEEKGCPCRC